MDTADLTVAAFAALTIAALVINEAGRRESTRWPAIGDVFSVLTSTGKGRFAVMLAWWWLGWHFFVR
jgi:hypothetical protein